MGEVYRADDLKLGQPVALKFLPANSSATRRGDRLLAEVRSARTVSHRTSAGSMTLANWRGLPERAPSMNSGG